MPKTLHKQDYYYMVGIKLIGKNKHIFFLSLRNTNFPCAKHRTATSECVRSDPFSKSRGTEKIVNITKFLAPGNRFKRIIQENCIYVGFQRIRISLELILTQYQFNSYVYVYHMMLITHLSDSKAQYL